MKLVLPTAFSSVAHILSQPWPFYSGDSNEPTDKLDGIKRFADDFIAKVCW